MVSRAQYMMADGIRPENILMFTFTNKACGEMKERVGKKIGPAADNLLVRTYHSFCGLMLRKYAKYLGFKSNFTIYDTKDKEDLIKKLLKGKDLAHTFVADLISKWKEEMISPTVALQRAEEELHQQAAEVYAEYQTRMRAQNAMDFDDLIYYAIRVIEDNPSIQHDLNERYQYIITDESQDSSVRDLRFLELMAGERFNLCMVADDEQAIYGWRGADVHAVIQFIEDHNMVVYELGQNYRSTQNIVNAARSLIKRNTIQLDKNVFSTNEVGEKVICFESKNTADEAIQVVKTIMALNRKAKVPLKEIAVLYRVSYLSRVLEEALLKNGIHYNIVGGTPFYSRKEVKDVLSYVRFLSNPQDLQAFERILNTPKRGIGETSSQKIIDNYSKKLNTTSCIDEHSFGIISMMSGINTGLKGTAKTGFEKFIEVLGRLSKVLEEDDNPSKLLREVIEATQYRDYLRKSGDENVQERLENLTELVEIAANYTSTTDFLHNMMLSSDETEEEEQEDNENKVQLMTMHSSKGLEFDAVLIVGANDGVVPHHRCSKQMEIEEERRLFYVAMTRARKYLFILRSKIAIMGGMLTPQRETRFLKEIDSQYLIRAS